MQYNIHYLYMINTAWAISIQTVPFEKNHSVVTFWLRVEPLGATSLTERTTDERTDGRPKRRLDAASFASITPGFEARIHRIKSSSKKDLLG